MRIALEAAGYEILVARDGNQGLALAEREDPDLVILDMMMPKRSGFLVLEKLRRTRPVPVRIIMVTANEGSRHKAYAEMLGRGRLHPQALRHGPAVGQRRAAAGLTLSRVCHWLCQCRDWGSTGRASGTQTAQWHPTC